MHSQVVSKSMFSGFDSGTHFVVDSDLNMSFMVGFSVGSSLHLGVIFGLSIGLQEIHKIISFISGSSKSL